MTFRLKPGQPDFEVVDGPFAGRRYVADQVYVEVPQGEECRFERADLAPVVPLPRVEGGRLKAEKKRTPDDESA